MHSINRHIYCLLYLARSTFRSLHFVLTLLYFNLVDAPVFEFLDWPKCLVSRFFLSQRLRFILLNISFYLIFVSYLSLIPRPPPHHHEKCYPLPDNVLPNISDPENA